MATTHSPAPSELARMRKVRRAGAIGNFIEYFDNALYAYFAVTIAKLFFPTVDPVAGLLSTFAVFGVAFLIRPVGGVVFGHIGDRLGRKRQLILALLLMSVSTTILGLLPTYATVGVLAPALLLVCRLLQGFSVGGESTGAFVLVVEHSPAGRRGRNTAPLIVSSIAGAASAALLAMITTSVLSAEALTAWGWRLPFFVAVPLGIVGLYLRLHIDESEAFKEAAKESAVINAAAGHRHAPLIQAFRSVPKELFILFCWVALQAVAGYLTVGYMVTHLVQFEKLPMATALGVLVSGMVIAMLACSLFGRLVDRISRKKFAIMISVGLAIWVFPAFVMMSWGPIPAAIGLGIFASMQYATMISAGIAIVELFPVDVRASASGFAYSVAFSVFGGTVPFVATYLSANFGATAPSYYVIVFAVIGILVARFGLPNAREMDVIADPLEQQSPSNSGPTATTPLSAHATD
ncbi:MFS transporter [Arthrobacter sp. MMS18-M83]|uniref:MFS transporter n=1 Tax=Arthrobacter sp. MMS18-M83 TaxID=2996261 RepID=UPI00227B97EF|nr:MFS transporter [Arthrobacter sp. MMS18-M83]WAH96327.1 MFS transporter [Arthrobacter sp. MMS18-M83]